MAKQLGHFHYLVEIRGNCLSHFSSPANPPALVGMAITSTTGLVTWQTGISPSVDWDSHERWCPFLIAPGQKLTSAGRHLYQMEPVRWRRQVRRPPWWTWPLSACGRGQGRCQEVSHGCQDVAAKAMVTGENESTKKMKPSYKKCEKTHWFFSSVL